MNPVAARSYKQRAPEDERKRGAITRRHRGPSQVQLHLDSGLITAVKELTY